VTREEGLLSRDDDVGGGGGGGGGIMDHGGLSRGGVYVIFGREGRFCCSAFDMFCSVLWFACWDRGWISGAVSGL
jgi:hypothetical protein